MAHQFRRIDPDRDAETVFSFFIDTVVISYANQGVDTDSYKKDEYINRLRTNIERFPDGYVLLEEDGLPIGQLELNIRAHEGRPIGYVSGYYLIDSHRGKGYGDDITRYAEDFFRAQGVGEYHLRVSVDNERAIRFCEKNGLANLGEEISNIGCRALRMAKVLDYDNS